MVMDVTPHALGLTEVTRHTLVITGVAFALWNHGVEVLSGVEPVRNVSLQTQIVSNRRVQRRLRRIDLNLRVATEVPQ